jgi:hypothetical protein
MKYFVVLSFVFLLTDCKKSSNAIPNVAVDFNVYLNEPSYSALNAPGNFVYLTGGYKGIILYRFNIETFIAYDRACSYDPYVGAAIITVDSTGLGLSDHNCGSKFNILDGSVTKSPASLPLKRYGADFDGVSVVHVHN